MIESEKTIVQNRRYRFCQWLIKISIWDYNETLVDNQNYLMDYVTKNDLYCGDKLTEYGYIGNDSTKWNEQKPWYYRNPALWFGVRLEWENKHSDI